MEREVSTGWKACDLLTHTATVCVCVCVCVCVWYWATVCGGGGGDGELWVLSCSLVSQLVLGGGGGGLWIKGLSVGEGWSCVIAEDLVVVGDLHRNCANNIGRWNCKWGRV